MAKLIVETGINKNGDCVIILSPELYDKLIDECREITEQVVKAAKEKNDKQLLKDGVEQLTMVIQLGRNPKYVEILNAN